MNDKSIYEPVVARDRLMAAVMVDIRKEMTQKIIALQKEQTRLTLLLADKFNVDDYRKLNIVNQNILVACSRRKGEWVKGDNLNYATIAK